MGSGEGLTGSSALELCQPGRIVRMAGQRIRTCIITVVTQNLANIQVLLRCATSLLRPLILVYMSLYYSLRRNVGPRSPEGVKCGDPPPSAPVLQVLLAQQSVGTVHQEQDMTIADA